MEKNYKDQEFKFTLKDKEIKHYQEVANDLAR